MTNDTTGTLTVHIEGEGEHLARVIVFGELDLATAPTLREQLERLEADTVTLDLAGVEFIDATGLRSLLACAADADRHGREVRSVACSGPVRRLLEMTGTRSRLRCCCRTVTACG